MNSYTVWFLYEFIQFSYKWYGAHVGGPKTLKRDILRVFTMSLFENIKGDYRLMTHNRKRLFKRLNAILTP